MLEQAPASTGVCLDFLSLSGRQLPSGNGVHGLVGWTTPYPKQRVLVSNSSSAVAGSGNPTSLIRSLVLF